MLYLIRVKSMFRSSTLSLGGNFGHSNYRSFRACLRLNRCLRTLLLSSRSRVISSRIPAPHESIISRCSYGSAEASYAPANNEANERSSYFIGRLLPKMSSSLGRGIDRRPRANSAWKRFTMLLAVGYFILDVVRQITRTGIL